MSDNEQDHDHTHAVHPGTTGGMGGSEPEGERDRIAAGLSARQGDPHADDAVDLHEAEVAQDLGADERSEPL